MAESARLRLAMSVAFGFALALLTGTGCGKSPTALAPPDAATVADRHPAMTDYAPIKEFTGRLVTKDPVKVVPQVSGMLLRRTFVEGDIVKGPVEVLGIVVRPGTLIFERSIEPRFRGLDWCLRTVRVLPPTEQRNDDVALSR